MKGDQFFFCRALFNHGEQLTAAHQRGQEQHRCERKRVGPAELEQGSGLTISKTGDQHGGGCCFFAIDRTGQVDEAKAQTRREQQRHDDAHQGQAADENQANPVGHEG